MSASRTLAAGHSSNMGLYEVPCEESLPGLGIGMTNEVFQIDGRQQEILLRTWTIRQILPRCGELSKELTAEQNARQRTKLSPSTESHSHRPSS